ncbi:MAG: NAD(P)-binding domain-containing protein [Albidovulum sp.]|nr:NAD(P)-binding domain-containing protein [Albidovulum sp.]
MPEFHEIAIVGAGQGGLSVSYFLAMNRIEHLVLERGCIADSWKSRRWDSFCLVTPNWSIRLPGAHYSGDAPEGFMLRDDFVDYMEAWAKGFGAPVRTGIDVRRIGRDGSGSARFALETSAGPILADIVVVATATYQKPSLPAAARGLSDSCLQMHAEQYRNPVQSGDGAVLVVGSGQTGCQIVEDFLRAGQKVYLSVGKTGRLPRRYRGRDCIEWQAEMGTLDRTPDMLDSPGHRFRSDPHVTGRDGGATVSLNSFRKRGVSLLGRLRSAEGDLLRFEDSLGECIEYADEFATGVNESVDRHVRSTGRFAPDHDPRDDADDFWPPGRKANSLDNLSLSDAGIDTVIWATGFEFDFSWIDFPVTDSFGYPRTEAGASSEPGLFFCGLNWMTKRKSGILYGVGEDARTVAEKILKLRQEGSAPAAREFY